MYTGTERNTIRCVELIFSPVGVCHGPVSVHGVERFSKCTNLPVISHMYRTMSRKMFVA